MIDENNPFVLELEIDDEISFKPVSRKGRALQELDCNTVATPEKSIDMKSPTRTVTPSKSFMSRLTSPRTAKESKKNMSTSCLSADVVGCGQPQSPCVNSPASAAKSGRKIQALLSRLTPARLKSTPKRSDIKPALKKPSPAHESLGKKLFDMESSETVEETTSDEDVPDLVSMQEEDEEDVTTEIEITHESVSDAIQSQKSSEVFDSWFTADVSAAEPDPVPATSANDSFPSEFVKLKTTAFAESESAVIEATTACVEDVASTEVNAEEVVEVETTAYAESEQAVVEDVSSPDSIDSIVNDISDMMLSINIGDSMTRSNPRRVSSALALHDEYQESMHMPKYSQAEMDTFKAMWQKDQSKEAENRLKLSVQELSDTLDAKDKLYEDALLTISALRSEVSEMKMSLANGEEEKVKSASLSEETRALTEQCNDLKNKLESAEKSHTHQIEMLKSDHQKHVMNVMTTGAQSLIEAKQSISDNFEKMLNEEKTKSAAHLKALEEAQQRATTLETDLPVAVQEAKRKVYEKAQAQFAAGNKEFMKVKNSLREVVSAKEEADNKIATLEETVKSLTAQVSAAGSEKDNAQKELLAVSSRLEMLVKADAGVLPHASSLAPIEAVEGVLKYYRDKTGEHTQQLSKTRAEKAQLETAIQELEEKSRVAQLKIKEMQEGLLGAESKASTAADALASSKRENQSQLLLVANVMSEKGRLESELNSSKTEVAALSLRQTELEKELSAANDKVTELTTRCEELRVMNKDAIEMLEAMYAKEEA